MQGIKLNCINKYFVLIFAIKILNIYRIYFKIYKLIFGNLFFYDSINYFKIF